MVCDRAAKWCTFSSWGPLSMVAETWLRLMLKSSDATMSSRSLTTLRHGLSAMQCLAMCLGISKSRELQQICHVYAACLPLCLFTHMQTSFLRHSICCRINHASQQWLNGTKQPDNLNRKAETSEGFQDSTTNEASAEQQQAATAVASA